MVKRFMDKKIRARKYEASNESRCTSEEQKKTEICQEIAINAKQKESARMEKHAVAATMRVNVVNQLAHLLQFSKTANEK